jgi:integrase
VVAGGNFKATTIFRRTIGTAPVRKAPATAELIEATLARCDGSPIGLRDRALLALGSAGAIRRSELVALEVADLEPTADGWTGFGGGVAGPEAPTPQN